jgi:hypothetical protein
VVEEARPRSAVAVVAAIGKWSATAAEAALGEAAAGVVVRGAEAMVAVVEVAVAAARPGGFPMMLTKPSGSLPGGLVELVLHSCQRRLVVEQALKCADCGLVVLVRRRDTDKFECDVVVGRLAHDALKQLLLLADGSVLRARYTYGEDGADLNRACPDKRIVARQ